MSRSGLFIGIGVSLLVGSSDRAKIEKAVVL